MKKYVFITVSLVILFPIWLLVQTGCFEQDQSEAAQSVYMNEAMSILANVTDGAVDYTLALEDFENAIRYGCDSAYAYAAQFYEYGVGTVQDLEKATEYYKKGAAKNDPFCLHKLSLISNTASARIYFPDNVNVKYQDLIVMADSVLTNVNGDGSFSCCKSSFVSVYNKEGQLIYCGYNDMTNGGFRLNSKTTAISILMFSYYLPFALEGSVDISSFDDLWNIASHDSNVDSLSLIIDDIIVQNGFLDVDKFSTAFTNIAHKLADNNHNTDVPLSKNSGTGLSQDALVISGIHGYNKGVEISILKSSYNNSRNCFDTQFFFKNSLKKELYCYVTNLSNNGTPIIPDFLDVFITPTAPSKISYSQGEFVEEFEIKDGNVLVITSPVGKYIPTSYKATYVVWNFFGKIVLDALLSVGNISIQELKAIRPPKLNWKEIKDIVKNLVSDYHTKKAIEEAIQARNEPTWTGAFDNLSDRFIKLYPTFFDDWELYNNSTLFVDKQSITQQSLFNELVDMSLTDFRRAINAAQVFIVSQEKIYLNLAEIVVTKFANIEPFSYYVAFKHIHEEDEYNIRVYNGDGDEYSLSSNEEIVFGSDDDRCMKVTSGEPSEYDIYIDERSFKDQVKWIDGGVGVGPGFNIVLPDLDKSVNVRIVATSHASRNRKTELNFSYRVDGNKVIVEQPIIEMPAPIEQMYESQIKNVTVNVANELCDFELYIDDEHYVPNGVNLKNTHTIIFPLKNSEGPHKLEVWAYPVADGRKFTMSEPWYYDVVKQGQLVIKNPIAPNGDIYAGQEYSFGIRTDYGTSQISSTKYFTVDGKREGPYSGSATHTITFKAIDRPGVITVEASANQYKPASWSWYYTPTPRVKVTQKPASSVDAGEKVVIKAESDVVCDFEVVVNGSEHFKGSDLKYSSDKAMEFEFANTKAGNKYSFYVIAKTRADKNHPSKEGVSDLMYVEVTDNIEPAPQITSVKVNGSSVSNGKTVYFDYDERWQVAVTTDVECEKISIEVPGSSRRSKSNSDSYSPSYNATESGTVTITATKNGKTDTFEFKIDVEEKPVVVVAPEITSVDITSSSIRVEDVVYVDFETSERCKVEVYIDESRVKVYSSTSGERYQLPTDDAKKYTVKLVAKSLQDPSKTNSVSKTYTVAERKYTWVDGAMLPNDNGAQKEAHNYWLCNDLLFQSVEKADVACNYAIYSNGVDEYNILTAAKKYSGKFRSEWIRLIVSTSITDLRESNIIAEMEFKGGDNAYSIDIKPTSKQLYLIVYVGGYDCGSMAIDGYYCGPFYYHNAN